MWGRLGNLRYCVAMMCVCAMVSCGSGMLAPKELTKEELAQLATTNDYDSMLDQVSRFNSQLDALYDDYLASKMTERQAKEAFKEMLDRYAPVIQALKEADSCGELTYDQQQLLADFHVAEIDRALGVAVEYAGDTFNTLIGEGAEEALRFMLEN